jgi:putative membrane protein
MKLYAYALSSAVCLCGLAALIGRAAAQPTQLAVEETRFLQQLHMHGRGEIMLAQFIETKRISNPLKDYAERLISDHTTLEEEIRALTHARNVPLSDEIPPESLAVREELAPLEGPALERAYMRRALTEHRGMMSQMEEQSRNARDPGVRDLAHTAHARAREHLALAQRWDPTLSPAPPLAVRTAPSGH